MGLYPAFVIAANLAIGIIRIVGNVIIVSVRGAAADAKRHSLSQKLDKTTFSIYPEGGYFRVEQDQDNGQGVYVKIIGTLLRQRHCLKAKPEISLSARRILRKTFFVEI